ncbi:MAG: PIN domain-containing protein [Actinobacteria bacterium]|nr:PIN domain-containing protein [Actinomycetota bacterium]
MTPPEGSALIDTSLWIEALRRLGAPAARRAVVQVVEPGMALVNGLIRAELLKGAKDEPDFRRLELLLEATTSLPFKVSTWARASRLGFDLRRAGVSVPTVDLAIAAAALEAGVPVLHRDAHFELIADHVALSQRFVGDR